ncbi:MAG: DNA alkylation repair protein [Bacilli bacterium]|nr:DNA alkylation repair protein [Bacilli bacterium]
MTKIQAFLFSQQDPAYRAFTLPLLPGIDEKSFLGVRLPILKKYAKDLDEESRAEFLSSLPHPYHEENILHAFILSNIKDYDDFLDKVDAFLSYVLNWSVCDTICNKHLAKYKGRLIQDVYRWMESKEIYRVRYAVKCLMNYYLGEDFEEEHLRRVAQIDSEEYYVRMMIAWYLATGLAKNYDSFVRAIEERRFPPFTHNKAIQKAVESYRVSEEHKVYLKTLKIK